MKTIDDSTQEELLGKYRLAGRIRFMSFFLLLFFLFLMKSIGGYSYLNSAFLILIVVEAILNQPYNFIVRRVNIYRFQYYQMITDIIAISWILYYMGGIEAPLVSIAYYAVILWAGVVSTTQAVFFAVLTSALLFSSIVISEHFGMLPFVSYYNYRISTAQMFSLLIGNVSFLFAFGYFSARSSMVIKSLERERQQESLKHAHKLLLVGYLIRNITHDVLNYLTSIKGYTQMLLEKVGLGSTENETLKSVEKLGNRSIDLLNRLGRFSQEPEERLESTDINKVIEDALGLTMPVVKYSNMAIKKMFGLDIPIIMANKYQLQEIFIVFILNALDAIPDEGTLTIKTAYIKENNVVEIVFFDTGVGIKKEDLSRIGQSFFTTKGPGKWLGLGLATAYGIVAGHKGKIDVESKVGKGTTFTIKLPVM